ncbi:MAG: amidohydrolase [Eubacteriales bacterium]|nr:amidohydrolase [Eubacteriales bacterium]MDD3880924.1 amidohydrolase [Eubacteriales bacterium]MDD4511709.1 amidohydrolase [Eubacteriales bacterium]
MSKADLVLVNGVFLAGEDCTAVCGALAVKNSRIAYIGGSDGAQSYIRDCGRVIDLKGAAVLPGMCEAHSHMQSCALKQFYQIFFPLHIGLQAVQAMIADYIARNPDLSIYAGMGYDASVIPKSALCSATLDALCPDKPLILQSDDGHSTWANSAAMRLAGITRETENPEGGIIVRDFSGEPTGYLLETAGAMCGGLMFPYLPKYTLEERKKAILWIQDIFLRRGVTSIYDPGVEPCADYYMAYEELAREGKLKIKVRGAWFVTHKECRGVSPEVFIDRCIAVSNSLTTPYFQVRAFKFLADMVLETETAYLSEPYSDRSDGWRGMKIWSDEELLRSLFLKVDSAGFQIHIHQMGDAAADYMLSALEYVECRNGKRDRRPAFAHMQLISDRDKARMARLGSLAIVAPYWMNMELYLCVNLPHIGEKRALLQYPAKSLMDAGVTLAVHSDYSVSMPHYCEAIFGLMTRTWAKAHYDMSSHFEGVYTIDASAPSGDGICGPMPLESERLSFNEAVSACSIGGARSMFLDGVTGSLSVGKLADLVAYAEDITRLEPIALSEREPVITICGGEIVFEA